MRLQASLTILGLAIAAGSCGGDGGKQFNYKTGLPFAEPKEFTSQNGVTTAALLSKEAKVDISGASVRGTVYNGAFVGPTLRVAPGEILRVTLQNELKQHTNIHYHGMHVSPDGNSDNIFLMVLPGQTFDYELQIPADHDPGTFWYHSHMHMDSESQVFGGLSGVLIVEGLEQRLPGLPQHHATRVRAERSASEGRRHHCRQHQLRCTHGAHGEWLGRSHARHEARRDAALAPRNISADIFYDLVFAAQPFIVIAEDGSPVEKLWTAMDLILPPGKRFDVIVTAPTTAERLSAANAGL